MTLPLFPFLFSLFAIDAQGSTLKELAIARTPPPGTTDDEALRLLAHAKPGEDLPLRVNVSSWGTQPRGKALDAVTALELKPAPCPPGLSGGGHCAFSKPLRLVIDEVDRAHPRLIGSSLVAELGGTLRVGDGASADTVMPVASAFGKSRVRLRARLVRLRAGGPPPLGRNDDEAVRFLRSEVDRASSVWSVCGISFGPSTEVDVRVVDPPPPYLLSLGCDAPAPAAGGEIGFRVDGREIRVPLNPGTSPRGAARKVAAQLEKLGFRATVSDNRTTHSATVASSDVLVAKRSGELVALSPPKRGPVSSDAALDACIGHVSLEDGLQHFSDSTAASGTIEERTLIKAFDDGDPSTLDVFVLPSFGGDARIGESFIFTDHGAIRNVVIEDRAGFRAARASFTLAHEIGHVLLDQPGHPDDFQSDTPTSLMDSDAVNATAFGPRRLSIAECQRAQRQSGSGSVPGLLGPWTPSKKRARDAKSQ